MIVELQGLKKNNTWSLVSLPLGKKVWGVDEFIDPNIK